MLDVLRLSFCPTCQSRLWWAGCVQGSPAAFPTLLVGTPCDTLSWMGSSRPGSHTPGQKQLRFHSAPQGGDQTQKLRLSAAARGWQPWSQDECSKGARAARGVGPGPPSEAPALLGSSQKCSLCLKWEVAEDWVLEPTVSAHGGWSWAPLD